MTYLLDHPEISELFENLLTTLVGESDRGAVLVGAAYVDEHLAKLFQAVFPENLGKKRRKQLLRYPGPLGGYSAKTELAFALRFIPKDVYMALHALRRIRNEVAHHPDTFILKERATDVQTIFELGPNLPAGIRQLAAEMMMTYKAEIVIERARELEREDPSLAPIEIKTKQDVAEYLSSRPEMLKALEEQVSQWELALGIAILCAMITYHRDRIATALGPKKLLSQIASESNESNIDGAGE